MDDQPKSRAKAVRVCLKCRREFNSQHPINRLCSKCSHENNSARLSRYAIQAHDLNLDEEPRDN